MEKNYKKELFSALKGLETEKGISQEDAVESLKNTLLTAYKKNFDGETNVETKIDPKKKEFSLLQIKEVIADGSMIDPYSEIFLKDARKINPAYEVGDKIKFEVNPQKFGRLAAQSGKNKSTQVIREKEKEAIYSRYEGFEHEIVTAKVARQDQRFLWVTMPDGQEAAMAEKDRIPGENYKIDDPIKVLISRVEDSSSRGPQIFVSRTSPELVKRLFEQEVPEVYDGVVAIVSIAREPGDRSKVAVKTTNSDIDPVGTLVGPRGDRVQAVVNELSGENMDIVEWVDDEAQYIANALNPSEVVDVIFSPDDDNGVTVIVPDYQLSLAIGKHGQNVRLAAKLTKFKIDIKSETQAENDPTLQAILEESDDQDEEEVPESDDKDSDVEYSDANDYLNDNQTNDEESKSVKDDDAPSNLSEDENDQKDSHTNANIDETKKTDNNETSNPETEEDQNEFTNALNNIDYKKVLKEKEGKEKNKKTN